MAEHKSNCMLRRTEGDPLMHSQACCTCDMDLDLHADCRAEKEELRRERNYWKKRHNIEKRQCDRLLAERDEARDEWRNENAMNLELHDIITRVEGESDEWQRRTVEAVRALAAECLHTVACAADEVLDTDWAKAILEEETV